jgi:hypothetical protein
MDTNGWKVDSGVLETISKHWGLRGSPQSTHNPPHHGWVGWCFGLDLI